MRLPEADAGEYSADRDGDPDGGPEASVWFRDLLAADALESAQREAPGAVAIQRQERAGGGHGSGRLYPGPSSAQRRIRRRRHRWAPHRAAPHRAARSEAARAPADQGHWRDHGTPRRAND